MPVFETQVRTGVWHNDRPLALHFQSGWDVAVFWPHTPTVLTDHELGEILDRPIGQPPIREMCRGKSRPLVIVDDPNRPTPAGRVMPFLFRQFQAAGIAPEKIRILLATGTHGTPRRETVPKKVGREPASNCQVVVHDPNYSLVSLGRTSFGTPVTVSSEVARSDFVMGIGGIYPSHTVGFGGGSKLALGVLGFQSIRHLHYRHQAVGWGALETASDFRKDLDEIAGMIGLRTMVSLQVDAHRQVVRMDCGDPSRFYDHAVASCRQIFGAPMPEQADVVISNAYPNDLSLTFAQLKGIAPLHHCAPGASRIAIASCSEGVGHHGLFPFLNRPRFHRQVQFARRITTMKSSVVARKVLTRLRRGFEERFLEGTDPQPAARRGRVYSENPIWLFRPGDHAEPLPSFIPGFKVTESWEDILSAIRIEQGQREHLRVVLYPCAPLQCPRPRPVLEESLSTSATASSRHWGV